MAAATIAAIATVPDHRDPIIRASAVAPLIELLTSNELGTPEAAARAFANLRETAAKHHCNLRTAAFVLGVGRVRDATALRGL